MDERLNKLIQTFQSKGWKSKGSADVSSDWWFSEIIELSSTWRPINKVIFLTLLTDPQILDKKVIWCIGISSGIPNNRHYKFIDQLTLNDINHEVLPAFVKNINKLVLVDN